MLGTNAYVLNSGNFFSQYGVVRTSLRHLPCLLGHFYKIIVSLQVWINGGDIILVGLRDYQDGKADVILKYTPDEARNLKAYGELPESGVFSSSYKQCLVDFIILYLI